VGGVGDYLDVADRVILMEDYEPSDATPRAREVTSKFPPRAPLGDREVLPPKTRRVRATSIDLRRGRRKTARGRGLRTIELGRERVDLSYIEQLAEAGQTETIARLIGEFATAGESRGVKEVVEEALASISENHLDSLGSFKGHPVELSLPRAHEVAAAINRVRSLEARTG
jgi:predicted ABC-class ATPase